MSTHSKQKKAAKEIAEILYASLQQFSEQEQQRRITKIQEIGEKAKLQERSAPGSGLLRSRR